MESGSTCLPAASGIEPVREFYQHHQHRHVQIEAMQGVVSADPQQSHPFTIARASTSGTSTDDNVKSSLRLLIKTRSGLTRKLASRAAANQITNTNTDPLSSRKGMRVIVEGPYGHLSERLEAFDDVLLIAGGVGGTFVWPIAEDLTRKGKKFKLIWTVKSACELSC